MPELPEVETVCRGIAPVLMGNRLQAVTVRRHDLRLPVPGDFVGRVQGQIVTAVERRAKYVLIALESGEAILVHLGMSGKVVVYPEPRPTPAKHDHVLFTVQETGQELAFNDPRRFGLVTLASVVALAEHPLLANLGVEPFAEAFNAEYLHQRCQGRQVPIKTLIMDNAVVVGVGNIYASESLFRAGLSPMRAAASLTRKEACKLVIAIRQILEEAIASGGSTLRDYVRSSGDSGYFQHHFAVYGRNNQPCQYCATPIVQLRQAGRASFYCPVCQPNKRCS